MYINANDIMEWRRTILLTAKDIACLRGNVADEVITRLANTLKDMAFLVSYAASQLKAECDCTVSDEALELKKEISCCINAENERVERLKMVANGKRTDPPKEDA